MNLRKSLWLTFGLGLILISCTEQYDPREERARWKEERKKAHEKIPELQQDGSLPKPVEKKTAGAPAGIEQKYAQLCASCHGDDGLANTVAAKALNPRPKNLTTLTAAQHSDDHLYKVIKEGGTAVGLSATMAAWGGVLTDDEVKEMVTFIKKFSGL